MTAWSSTIILRPSFVILSLSKSCQKYQTTKNGVTFRPIRLDKRLSGGRRFTGNPAPRPLPSKESVGRLLFKKTKLRMETKSYAGFSKYVHAAV